MTKKMRGDLPISVRSVLSGASDAGGASTVQKMTMKSGLSSTHHVAATHGGATCASAQAQSSDVQLGVVQRAGAAMPKRTQTLILSPVIATSPKMRMA